jgi:hypothetical protein
MRANVSGTPPGGFVMMNLIGRLGDCARAACQTEGEPETKPAAHTSDKNRRFVTIASLLAIFSTPRWIGSILSSFACLMLLREADNRVICIDNQMQNSSPRIKDRPL